jgi:hypothetical protein
MHYMLVGGLYAAKEKVEEVLAPVEGVEKAILDVGSYLQVIST